MFLSFFVSSLFLLCFFFLFSFFSQIGTLHIRQLLPFKYLNNLEFELIIDSLKIQYYQSNEIICTEDEIGDQYYIIADGTCVVSKYNQETNENIELAVLQPSDGFGEMALIREVKEKTRRFHFVLVSL